MPAMFHTDGRGRNVGPASPPSEEDGREYAYAPIQCRTDLYAAEFTDSAELFWARQQLPTSTRGEVWDKDSPSRLIVTSDLLKRGIFNGLRFTQTRVVSHLHFWTRVCEWLTAQPELQTDGQYSAAFERIFIFWRTTRYFPYGVYHNRNVVKSFAMAIVYQRETLERLFFPATNDTQG